MLERLMERSGLVAVALLLSGGVPSPGAILPPILVLYNPRGRLQRQFPRFSSAKCAAGRGCRHPPRSHVALPDRRAWL